MEDTYVDIDISGMSEGENPDTMVWDWDEYRFKKTEPATEEWAGDPRQIL